MGITGLLPFIENASRKCYINEFRGYTVAIDSYCWLHKGAFSCAEKLVRGEETNAHIMYCLKYIRLLLDYNIKPIMVFDGQHLPAKKDTESKRREQRKASRARATELLRLGKIEEARQNFRRCVDITHDMALALIKECRKRNIDCIVAPYEADAQLAYLNTQGIAHMVITEDSDLVLFGCSKILFKFSLDGSATLVESDKLYLAMKMRPDEYSFDKFRYMCIISGCDYLDSLPGIGLKKAHKAVVMTHDPNIYNLLPRLPTYLNIRKLIVSKEYIENFKLADATIRHQVVFDPLKRVLVRLTDPGSTGIGPEHLKNAGEMSDNDRAFQMALGNIDPFSLTVKDDWNPDVAISSIQHSSSIWFREYKKPKSPQRISNRAVVSAKSTKNLKVTVSTENIVAVQQQMLDYDNNLTEELKMYQNKEPPSKRQKLSEEPNDEIKKSELNSEVNEPELKLEICNPFIKNKLPKKLSKFGSTSLESNQCVRSPFFASKTKAAVCISEVEGNKKNVLEQEIRESGVENISEGETLVNTYSQSTICSNEGSEESNGYVTRSDGINLKTFAHNKSLKKMCKSVNGALSLTNFSNEEEYKSESFLESEDTPTSTSSQSLIESTPEIGSQKTDITESNNNGEVLSNMDGHLSPVLSSPVIKKLSRNKGSSSLERFNFDSLKKKMPSVILRKQNSNFPNKETVKEKNKEEHTNTESDIENLTPDESFTEKMNQNSVDTTPIHYGNCKEAIVFTSTSYNAESISNIHKKDTDIYVIDESEDSTLHHKIQNIVAAKRNFKKSDSCRTVGLSRNRKKVSNQPTILSMFNKMAAKD